MDFTRDRLLQTLSTLPDVSHYRVAYSGGLDSQVLLHALASRRSELPAPLQAIHIHHGLQPDADHWAEQCRAYCREQQIPLTLVECDVKVGKGESLEAAARDARYHAFREQMGDGDILLTAHHCDDQAETVLLQLLRGSGLRGLSAMPFLAPFGPGYLARPLLDFSRAQLAAYAAGEGLEWAEDASNRDIAYDRNFLRQQVLPLLVGRWPALGRTLSRSARHCAEAQRLIDEMAQADLDLLRSGEGEYQRAPASITSSLSLTGLGQLPPPRARAVLRAWIRESDYRLPDTARLDRLLREMTEAAADRNPMIHWAGVEARRYRDRLYLMPPLPAFDESSIIEWDGETSLQLPSGLGLLTIEKGKEGIDRQRWLSGRIRVRFRSGGECCRPASHARNRPLKKLFQEEGIPPWLRARIPLITIDDQLAAVAGLWLCEPFRATKGEDGILIRWERAWT